MRSSWRPLGLMVVLAVAAIWLTGALPARATVVGESMLPGLHDGQRVGVRKLPAWLAALGRSPWERGDLVVFTPPAGADRFATRRFVKRLVALPGDRIRVSAGRLLLDGRSAAEPYALVPADHQPHDDFPELLLYRGELVSFEGYAPNELPDYLQPALAMLEPPPEALLARSYAAPLRYLGSLRLAPGYGLVLGDNRAFARSEDSRAFGPVPLARLTGRIIRPAASTPTAALP